MNFSILFLIGLGASGAFAQARINIINDAYQLDYLDSDIPVAQGSVVSITTGLPGMLPALTVPATNGFPLTTDLGGVSVSFHAADREVRAWILSITPALVRAVVPSTTPIGDHDVHLYLNNEIRGVGRVRVVKHEIGVYRNSASGQAALQNVTSDGRVFPNGFSSPARFGQTVILWATGLGATGDETDRPAPGDLASKDLDVLVGNRHAIVTYAGRSGCCAGVDQIVFQIPAGVEGCHTPVFVRFRDGSAESNIAPIAVAAEGDRCSDTRGLPDATLDKVERGSISMATFINGAAFFTLGRPDLSPPPGTCTESSYYQRPGLLDAGPELIFRTPQGVMSAPRSSTNSYRVVPSPNWQPGGYEVTNLEGGADVGGFHFSVQAIQPRPEGPTYNYAKIVRGQDLELTWEASETASNHTSIVVEYDTVPGPRHGPLYGASLRCIELSNKGVFRISASLLWRARTSGADLIGITFSDRISHYVSIPGIDLAEFLSPGGSVHFKTQEIVQ